MAPMDLGPERRRATQRLMEGLSLLLGRDGWSGMKPTPSSTGIRSAG